MLFDFGAAWDEHEAEPIEVTVRPFDAAAEETITLPGSMPAGLRLHMWEVQSRAADGNRKLTYGELQAAGRYLFGPATFQRWLDERITEDRLGTCVMSVLAEYKRRETARAEETAPPGEAPGGSEPPVTSSTTSVSSKPTSSTTTASTSPTTSGG